VDDDAPSLNSISPQIQGQSQCPHHDMDQCIESTLCTMKSETNHTVNTKIHIFCEPLSRERDRMPCHQMVPQNENRNQMTGSLVVQRVDGMQSGNEMQCLECSECSVIES